MFPPIHGQADIEAGLPGSSSFLWPSPEDESRCQGLCHRPEPGTGLLLPRQVGAPAPRPTGCLVPCVHLVGSLTDSSGRILIPGIYDHVAPVTEEERDMCRTVDLDLEEYRKSSQVKKFLFDTKVWLQPQLADTNGDADPRLPTPALWAADLRSSEPRAWVLRQVFPFTATGV